MNDITKETVLAALKRAFPAYPATVQESPEDAATLWVRVFAVPVDQVRTVKDFIHDLEDTLPTNAQAMLLPMVKNLEVTRQYYTEFMPNESDLTGGALVEQYFRETVRRLSVWEAINASSSHAKDDRFITSRYDFGFDSISRDPFPPRRAKETNIIASNDALALAA